MVKCQTVSQIKEGLVALDEKLRMMPSGADADQQDMALTALCNSTHPLMGSARGNGENATEDTAVML